MSAFDVSEDGAGGDKIDFEGEAPGQYVPKRRSGRANQATTLVTLALAREVELFHTADHQGFAVIPIGDHREVWALRAGPFRRWLAREFYIEEGAAPGAQALQDAIGVLEGQALFDGAELDVHVRLAERAGAVYLDLADPEWRAVEITRAGWNVVPDSPVRFRRTRGMLALPLPEAGGHVDELRDFVNVGDEDWPLLAAWLLAAMRPRGPFPVLPIHGEQGSAKSTTARVLRSLVDPNIAPLRSEPRDGRDLMIAARNGWVIGFDNVSHLSPWLSDAICRLATGGGFATRELYADTDEVLIEVQRPVILNGIEDLATRGDLLDRAIVLYLPRIRSYVPEEELFAAFERRRPRILGALLDVVVHALGAVHDVRLERPPRMADFATWATAAEPALGWGSGAFLAAYAGNRSDANELTLEASPVTQPVREIAEVGFTGTATELLARLAGLVGEETAKQKAWPKTAQGLSGTLRRLAPNLRAIGVEVESGRDPGGKRQRWISIRTTARKTVPRVPSVWNEPDAKEVKDGRDGRDAEMRTRSNDADEAAFLAEVERAITAGILVPVVQHDEACDEDRAEYDQLDLGVAQLDEIAAADAVGEL
jgi:hypothetical protein